MQQTEGDVVGEAIAVVDAEMGRVMAYWGCDVRISLHSPVPEEARRELMKWRGVRACLVSALPAGARAPTNPVDYWSRKITEASGG